MRPTIAPTRKEALDAFIRLYHGKPCVHCGGTVRLTWNHVCEPCNRAYVKEYKARKRLEAKAGKTTYHGKPCSTCGSTLRDTGTGTCRECRNRNRRLPWGRSVGVTLVNCPICPSRVGEWCVMDEGVKRRYNHMERLKKARLERWGW